MDEEKTGDERDEKEEKSISSDLIRGHINTIILRALYDGDKYGYEIIAEIERKSHGQYSLKQPSLYSALKRLEKEGYITSYWGGSVGGGRRKYFSLTDEGKVISEQNQSEWEYSRTVIDSLISDKEFDFNNPAPTAVNMRVLRSTTSRVPVREGEEEEELDYEPVYDDGERERLAAEYEEKNAALDADRAALDADRSKFEEEMRERNEAIRAEHLWRERELAERERKLGEERAAIDEARKEQSRLEADAKAREEARKAEDEELREALEAQEAERRRAIDEEEIERRRAFEEELEARRKREEEALAARRQLEDEELERLKARQEELSEREKQFVEERYRFSELLRERDETIEKERKDHAVELEELEKRIRREQEEAFRQREQELLHQNYLDLVSTPPAPAPESGDYSYYASPIAEPAAEEPAPARDRDYRTVVREIYSSAVQSDGEEPKPAAERAQSLDGIDFRDLEARAARDGIRISTAGGKGLRKQEDSASIVHRGKALFLSSIVLFCICLAEGSIVLAVQGTFQISLFWPYFIWCAGLAALLVAGLAYANHYGERSIRRKTPILINAIVAYALCVILTLIVALGVNIDFGATPALANYIVIPILFFFGIVVFGICYYFLTRPSEK